MRLIVMRHAKSDWNAGAESDHERPLNNRGRKEAPLVGARLANKGFKPDLVLSSDSTRTRQTFDEMRGAFPEVPVRFDASLYHAGLEQVLALAPTVPADAKTVLVLGHNPGWEEMVSDLAGMRVEMKTAYAAVLDSDAPTLEAALKSGDMKLVELVTPH